MTALEATRESTRSRPTLDLSREPRIARGAPASVELRRVSMSFGADLPVLDAVNLTLPQAEFIAIVGPSGCGKSTLLKLISGLERPTGGEVVLDGRPVQGTSPGVGFMFQRDALLPWATVDQNIAVGFDCRHVAGSDRRQQSARLLDVLGLAGFGGFYPRQLSGGMRQRVALGRLLAYAPDIYLMDEPFGALDAQTKLQMGNELLRIWSADRKTVVFVTHDIEEAISLSDRVIVLSSRPGRIKADYRIEIPRPRELRVVRRTAAFQRYAETIWDDVMVPQD